MFKKSVEAKSQQRLSGADKKKLKRTIRDRFPRASVDDIDALLPPKVEITVAKFQNRVHVYGVEGGFPMFFDVDGRGTEIYPTVFAMWMAPELLPSFVLKGGEVSRYVIGGADLMFPGISFPPEGLPSFLAGEPWAVKVPGNAAPFAVGSTMHSSAEALQAGLRGKALRIMHCYRDFLWESAQGRFVPNAGFFEDVVFEDRSILSSSETLHPLGGSDHASIDLASDIGNAEVKNSGDVNEVIVEPNMTSKTQLGPENSAEKQIITKMEDLNLIDNVSIDEPNVEGQHILSPGDVDLLLDKLLLQALHTTVKDKDLPIAGSILWSNHILPCRPSGITLDIKKSSHKKLSKWLQAKSAAGLISVKEDKYKKETVLTSVNRGYQDYLSFKPDKLLVEKNNHDDNVPRPSEVTSDKMLQVSEIYKSSVHVNPIFASVGADTGKLYSALEATEIVFKYIEKENLIKPADKSIVILDPTLCDALFKGAIKKGSRYPTEIHKKELGSTFISRMQAHCILTRGNESVIRKGSLKCIQILSERRQGNKKVTKVAGIEIFLIDVEAFASELQKKFACSTTVAELPGKKGALEVLIQGGVVEDVAKHLVEQYGVPKRYIEVLDKTKK